MKFLPILWSNLRRKKTRTILTMLSILIAFLLFGYLVTIDQALAMGVSLVGEDRLVTRHKVSLIQLLPASYEQRMESIDGVAQATHATWFGGVYQDPKNIFQQSPVKPEEYLEMYPEFLLPEEQLEAWKSTRTGAVVGRTIADKYGWEIGDKVPIQATIWRQKGGGATWTFDIVGIYDGADDGTDTTQFLFQYDYFHEARAMGDGLVGWYILRVEDPERAVEVANAIDQEFANSPAETRTETEMAFLQGFANQVGNVGKILMAVLAAVFFTILLVAGNTMAQAVRERTEEIGVLKAMGYRNGQVLGLVLGESLLLALLGGGLGLVLAWFFITTGGDPTGGALPIFYLPRGKVIVGLCLILGLGVVTGLLPALQAMRLNVSDALRRG